MANGAGPHTRAESTAQPSDREPAARRVFCVCGTRCTDPLPTYWVWCDRRSERRRSGLLLMSSLVCGVWWEQIISRGESAQILGTKKPRLAAGFRVQAFGLRPFWTGGAVPVKIAAICAFWSGRRPSNNASSVDGTSLGPVKYAPRYPYRRVYPGTLPSVSSNFRRPPSDFSVNRTVKVTSTGSILFQVAAIFFSSKMDDVLPSDENNPSKTTSACQAIFVSC